MPPAPIHAGAVLGLTLINNRPVVPMTCMPFVNYRRIVAITVMCLAAIAPGLGNAGTPTPFAPPDKEALVVYQHATLIDGTGAPPRPDRDRISHPPQLKGGSLERLFSQD